MTLRTEKYSNEYVNTIEYEAPRFSTALPMYATRSAQNEIK
jgi:hypothetical protein